MSTIEMFDGAAAVKKPRVGKPYVAPPAGRDPFRITDRTAISLSGGRTSAYMLRRILESNGGLPECATVMFANTGLEHEATLEFVATIEQRWKVPVTWIEYRPDGIGYAVVNFDTAARDGEPYEAMIRKERMLPNPVMRICTSRLKIRAMHRHLAELGWKDGDGWDQMIGIRADEPGRIARIRARGTSTEDADESMLMPLADADVRKREVGGFWMRQPFDLKLRNINGVTKDGNCVLCFLKPGAQVLSLIQEEPKRAVWYMRQEQVVALEFAKTDDGARFRNDRPSYAQMHAYALAQADLFRAADPKAVTDELMVKLMADDTPGPDCFCGNDDA
ncbi:MAG TPA: phosphoadenosine phosphosulfate reductase family protein [Burkholderiaceae bacterium]|nr:phosphoadenosine phosphosulfate reductase family protein [Burkholderiaceae bacterium]